MLGASVALSVGDGDSVLESAGEEEGDQDTDGPTEDPGHVEGDPAVGVGLTFGRDMEPPSVLDGLKTLEQRLLERELQSWCKRIAELRPSRKSNSNRTFRNPDVASIRDRHAAHVARILQLPEVPEEIKLAEVLRKETEFAGQPLSTHEFIHAVVAAFFVSRVEELLLEKSKITFRWNRAVSNKEDLALNEPELRTLMTAMNDEIADAKRRAQRLGAYFGSPSGPDKIEVGDIQLLIKSRSHQFECSKQFHRFVKKFQWLSLSKRYEVFRKASQAVSPETDQDDPSERVPHIIVHGSELTAQLSMLKKCFDIDVDNDADEGQELFHFVNRKFVAIFIDQVARMEFKPYRHDSAAALGVDGPPLSHAVPSGLGRGKGATLGDGDSLFIKNSGWYKYRALHPLPSERRRVQVLHLSNLTKVDPVLESFFGALEIQDPGVATKKLSELMESHHPRAFVRRRVLKKWNGVTRLEEVKGRDFHELFGPGTEDPAMTKAKVLSMYFLRFIRIREFRRKLLDMMNYFVSIEKRLNLDCHACNRGSFSSAGTPICDPQAVECLLAMLRDDNPLSRLGPDPTVEECLNSLDKSFDLLIEGEGGELHIQDPNGKFIMYQQAFINMEALERELAQIGTFFVFKEYEVQDDDTVKLTDSLEVDRFRVLEDLFESEAWFQETKRKVIDVYMEAYEHCTHPGKLRDLAQTVVDLIALRPSIDFEGGYFSRSYASDVVGLDLYHNLLRDILESMQAEDVTCTKAYLNRLAEAKQQSDHPKFTSYPVQNEMHSPFCNPRYKNMEDGAIMLGPNCTPVGLTDFFPQLGDIAILPKLLDSITEEMVQDFGLHRPIGVSALTRTLLQQGIVEWKLLEEETKIQKHMQEEVSSTVKSMDEASLLSDPFAINSVIFDSVPDMMEAIRKEQAQAVAAGKPLTTTVGGFSLENFQTSIILQSMCNAFEALHLRKNLLDILYETEVLFNAYYFQANIMGKHVTKFQLDALDFAGETSSEHLDSMDSNISVGETLSLRAQYLTNLAISEFESSLAVFDFQSTSGIKVSHTLTSSKN